MPKEAWDIFSAITGVSVLDPISVNRKEDIVKIVTDKFLKLANGHLPEGYIFDKHAITWVFPENIEIPQEVGFCFCRGVLIPKKGQRPIMFMVAEIINVGYLASAKYAMQL
ncbi:MAG TPA: hypothetical protein VF817_00745 [Patescibacteria group bacterium]